MGGYGSGGHNHSGKPSLDDCFCLSINDLRKQDIRLFKEKTEGNLTCGQLRIDWLVVQDCMLWLTYFYEGQKKSYQQSQGFQWLAHRRKFGGFQHYWVCMGCCRPKSKLYLYRWTLRCRDCHNLRYSSQRQRAAERIIEQGRKAEKILTGQVKLSKKRRERLRGIWERGEDYSDFEFHRKALMILRRAHSS